jgi:benzoyl-CoA 2,3-dioxygenase component A
MSDLNKLPGGFIRQHLIDPELCIRCNTCEETCPSGAITHDSRNYVINPETCNGCLDCIGPCPTGSIDNWRIVPNEVAYTLESQFGWDQLPEQGEVPAEIIEASKNAEAETASHQHVAPWSAAKPEINLFDQQRPAIARIVSNERITDPASGSDIHHIVLGFDTVPCPVLEGQCIGILPPGMAEDGKPHVMRAYSVASARGGEHIGKGDIALTVKRVTEDYDGKPYLGVCTNFLCDLNPGDPVRVVGPYGTSFLMPNHDNSSLMMICTGTGVAPMRAMIEQRRRNGNKDNGSMMLFYGGRTPGEIAYHDELMGLPAGLLDVNMAYSRVAGQPKQYVQDLLRAKAQQIVAMLRNDDCFIYVCGLKGMENGINEAFRDICRDNGSNWDELAPQLMVKARLHIETY